MRIDFRDAAKRHWEDAELLKEQKRIHNADHHYGVAAECALKEVMVILGTPTDVRGDIDKRFWKHMPDLWSEYQTFAQGRRGARYVSPLGRFSGNPFSDWHMDQRYAADVTPPTGAVLTSHAKACQACLEVLDRASNGI